LRRRNFDESLPWNHIDCGVDKTFFLRELEKSHKAVPTEECKKKCSNCGVCGNDVQLILWKDCKLNDINIDRQAEGAEIIKKYRIIYTKIDIARFLSHLEMTRAIIRALRRSDISLVYSKGFHPMPKISFSPALPVGMESVHEVMDIQVRGELNLSKAKRHINRELPKGIKILSIYEVPLKKKIAPKETQYVLIVRDGLLSENSDGVLDIKGSIYIKKGDREIDLKRLVKSLSVKSTNRVNITIRHIEGGGIRLVEIARYIFDIQEGDIIKIIKMGQVI